MDAWPVVVLAIAFPLMALLAILGLLPAFPPTLAAWTTWVSTVVGILITAKGLMAAARWLEKRAE